MELVEGTDLRRYIRSRGVLDVDQAVSIALDVALDLGAAHRRDIVYRNVQPKKVLIARSGSVKLTTPGIMLGNNQYAAPERQQGEIATPATDVYALGIIMYEMLTGRLPFYSDTPVGVAMQHIHDQPQLPSQINPSIPAALEQIILRCLEKVPEMRFRNGVLLALALNALAEVK
jgi:eukaryotic-like serine/threonine-protein kinase